MSSSSDPNRLRRIILECLEVSLLICSTDMEEFSTSKLFDVFDQLLATAFVLNTAYWVFFSTSSGQTLCVCGRFGFHCRHSKGRNHWADTRPVEHQTGHPIFHPRRYGHVVPTDPQDQIIDVRYLEGPEIGYQFIILLRLKYRKPSKYSRRGKQRCEQDQIPNSVYEETYDIELNCSYWMTPEFYPPMLTVVFHPNPFCHRNYGTLLPSVIEYCDRDAELHYMSPQLYCWANTQMPSTTFILRETNLPISTLPDRVNALILPLQDQRGDVLPRYMSNVPSYYYRYDLNQNHTSSYPNVFTVPPPTSVETGHQMPEVIDLTTSEMYIQSLPQVSTSYSYVQPSSYAPNLCYNSSCNPYTVSTPNTAGYPYNPYYDSCTTNSNTPCLVNSNRNGYSSTGGRNNINSYTSAPYTSKRGGYSPSAVKSRRYGYAPSTITSQRRGYVPATVTDTAATTILPRNEIPTCSYSRNDQNDAGEPVAKDARHCYVESRSQSTQVTLSMNEVSIKSESESSSVTLRINPLFDKQDETRTEGQVQDAPHNNEWFDMNFPPLEPSTSSMSYEERLELVDTVIKEEERRDREEEKQKHKKAKMKKRPHTYDREP